MIWLCLIMLIGIAIVFIPNALPESHEPRMILKPGPSIDPDPSWPPCYFDPSYENRALWCPLGSGAIMLHWLLDDGKLIVEQVGHWGDWFSEPQKLHTFENLVMRLDWSRVDRSIILGLLRTNSSWINDSPLRRVPDRWPRDTVAEENWALLQNCA